MSDRRLADVVAGARGLGGGIGGRTAELDVDGVRVFVKRVPLTSVEQRPDNVRSTANLFGLPLFYQYGIGSAGFGAWRELAAHLMTTGWVLSGQYPGFPLLHHWRVLPDDAPTGFADAFGGVDGAVAHWDGSAAVRHRLEEIGRSSAALVLFLEHVPHTLGELLAEDADGDRHRWAEEELRRGTEFMSARGLVHFDAHFANVLTDGRRIYFADLGLALSRDFELSRQERDFLTAHLLYDRSYAPSHLLRHHLPAGLGSATDPGALLRAWADGRRPAAVPCAIATLLDRHAAHATVLDDFFRRLFEESKLTPFPADALRRAMADGAGQGRREPVADG
ncbi:protein kinase family protein [Streptomyces mangrovisoli]|nr:protein kinase family protein [Streptomyces mangrovisoli]